MKEIKNDEELESISAGAGGSGEFKVCKKCEREFEISFVDRRKVDDGCGYRYEYKCPNCGEWN